MKLATDPLRITTAAVTVILGAIHLQLYMESYKDIPIDNIGRSFLLNAVASLTAAAVVMLWSHQLAPAAPLLLANSTLIAFGLSRTDRGIFGFTERGWSPTPQAAAAVAAEIAAAVFATLALATTRTTETDIESMRS
ncbi:MAG: hypothetical protein H0V26_09100 [Solirubrobacterales bacterium]|nr:hypothetical protein [Solirubrobacterales bacterium]